MNVLFYFDHQINPFKGGTERVSDILAHCLKQQGLTIYYCTRYRECAPNDIETLFLPNQEELLSLENVSFLERELKAKEIDYVINQASNGEDIYLFNHETLQTRAKLISVLHFSILEGLNYFKELQLLDFHLSKPKDWIPTMIRIAKRPYNQKKAMAGKARRFTYIYQHSDAVVVLSNAYIRDYLQLTLLSESDKLYVIPNPLTYLETATSQKENNLLFVGRLSYPEKRVDRLLYSWKQLYSKHPTWKLEIVGDGFDKVRLEKLAAKLKLKRISFCGMQNPISYYERAKIFCMTSTHEGLPMVLLEAMQNHVVPIAYNSFGAAQDIISNGVNGFLIKPFSNDEYVTQLSRLMSDASALEQVAAQTTINLERYNSKTICSQWLHLFQQLATKNDI